MQKWREKYGPRATYRNLAKMFYDAGKRSLVDSVCELVTHIHVTGISQIPYSPPQRLWLFATSQACKYCVLCVIVAVASVLLAFYTSQNDIPLDQDYFPFPSTTTNMKDDNTFQTELGRLLYRHKAGEVAPNNLPHFPGPFVGRDNDVNGITHLLLHSIVKSVHIFGLPAVGKSTLAIRAGYEMASRGVAVRYINVDDTHIFKSHDEDESEPSDSIEDQYLKATTTVAISKAFSDIALPWYSKIEKKFVSTTAQGLIEWAKGLSNSTLLILDNCDSLLQGMEGRNNDFIRVLDALSKASPYLCTVTTSRLKVKLLDAKPYNLKPLDNESAVELLHLVSPVMTRKNSRIINELLDGIPLALKIVGSLISEIRPPNLIIRELQQNLIETLTPEDIPLHTQKMRPVLKLSFNYLHSDTQECALYLSHFPGSFSEDAALHILSNCTNSAPIACLRNLTDTSLLDPYSYAGQSRYQFHRVIKEYLIDVESHSLPTTVTSMNALLNLSFVVHYTQTLFKFVSTYNQLPHDEENIGRFEYESHNFECLFEKVHVFNLWTVTSVVDITRALTCNFMLETFTKRELLKVGQQILQMFEDRMDAVSKEIGTLETLDVYHGLLLVLKKWIHSFLDTGCETLCGETFQDYEIRVKIIDRQLAKNNYSAYEYYRKLQFPLLDESATRHFCSVYCLFNIYSYAIWVSTANMVIETVMSSIERRVVFKRSLYSTRCICILILQLASVVGCNIAIVYDVSASVIFALYTVNSLYLRRGGFPTIRMMINHENLIICLTILYYIVLWVLLICAFGKHSIAVTNFFFFCTVLSGFGNLYSTSFGASILHISSLIFVFNTYIYEFETLFYVTSCVLPFVYLQEYGFFEGYGIFPITSPVCLIFFYVLVRFSISYVFRYMCRKMLVAHCM